jgi:hypothetical protein
LSDWPCTQAANGCKFLTVGDEEGCVSIVDASAEVLPSSLYTDHDRPPRAKWLAHNNTIFDMAWAKVSRDMVNGSSGTSADDVAHGSRASIHDAERIAALLQHHTLSSTVACSSMLHLCSAVQPDNLNHTCLLTTRVLLSCCAE